MSAPERVSGLPAVSGPPSPAEWQSMREQAEVIAHSGMAPRSVSTPEKVLVIAMKGRELSLPPMQALSHIHIVEGKPTLSAELMAALVQRAGHKLRVTETTSERCIVEGIRADDPAHPSKVEFSMDDAKRAGVAGKGPWKQYPAAMLRARAISALCRFHFADVLMGASFTPEELGASVNGEGEIVDAPDRGCPAPVRPIVSTEPTLDEYLEEIEKVHDQIPANSRAPISKIMDYIGTDRERARRSLGKLRKELESSRGESSSEEAQASVLSETVDEAEVIEDDIADMDGSNFVDPEDFDFTDEEIEGGS